MPIANPTPTHETEIHLAKGGCQLGPFSKEQIESMISAGMISADDMAWKQGATDWEPLGVMLGTHQSHREVQPEPPLPNPQSNPAPDPLGQTKEGPRGIGGWLTFFCIGLVVGSPLKALPSILDSLDSLRRIDGIATASASLKLAIEFEVCGIALLTVYGIVAGCIIWSGSPEGRKIARQFLVIRFLGLIAVELVTVLLMRGLPDKVFGEVIGSVTAQIVAAGILTAAWWAYFRKSKRVRNTYGPE